MKINQHPLLRWMFAVCALPLAALQIQAQTPVLINAFDTESEVIDNNGSPWNNWFGTAFYQTLFSPDDANGDAGSGSLLIETFYPDSGIGGCCGPQFVAYNGNDGISPPLAGNGAPPTSALATNVEFDLRFDASSVYDTNSGNFPTIEVGTRGIDFSQHVFGTVTVAATETNWVHVNIPITPNANWTSIPNIFFKHYSTTLNGWVRLYVDNIVFTTAPVEVVPPEMAIEKAERGLRIFAGSGGQYDRQQLYTVDTNQSWIGGTYPVSYSFTLSHYADDPPLGQVHLFLIPMDHVNGGAIDQYTDYSTASNNVWLQIVGGDGNVTANIAWKTNMANANPDQQVLNIVNDTAIGTWTLTFTGPSAGTLTAPGASPVPFTIDDPEVASNFDNPLVAFFGIQPNDPPAIGSYAQYASISTTGVAGSPVNTDFTTIGSIDTNVWSTTASARQQSLVLVGENDLWWVNWAYPDYGLQLETKADLADAAVPWQTPTFYTGETNQVFQSVMGTDRVWSLIPTSGLPTMDGTTNGPASSSSFFRLAEPVASE